MPWSSDAVIPSSIRSAATRMVSPFGSAMSTRGAESATTVISIGGGRSGTRPPGLVALHRNCIDRSASRRPAKVCPDGASAYEPCPASTSATALSGTDALPATSSAVPRGSRSSSPAGSVSTGRPR